MKAAIIAVGDELLNGQTVDTNAAWIAQRLNEIGVSVVIKMAVADEHQEIIDGLKIAQAKADIILMTGGLGPTKDDITKKSIADFLGEQMVFSEVTYQRISELFSVRGITMTDSHRQQCYMPESAILMENPRGTAPGMWMSHPGLIILSMPGVPNEMKAIMNVGAVDKIKSLVRDHYIEHYIIQTVGVGETRLADDIDDIIEKFPSNLSIAYLPSTASVKLRITGKGTDKSQIHDDVPRFGSLVAKRVEKYVFGIGNISLTEALQNLCIDKKVTVATAESCTGGGVAHSITGVAGSSAYFKGSVVAYANEIKQGILGVDEQVLKTHGAVSEETVSQMVTGAINLMKVDCAVAISGIAGPGGGSIDKPVGTIWLAVGKLGKVKTRKLQLVKDRQLNIEYTIVTALNELRLFVADNF